MVSKQRLVIIWKEGGTNRIGPACLIQNNHLALGMRNLSICEKNSRAITFNFRPRALS